MHLLALLLFNLVLFAWTAIEQIAQNLSSTIMHLLLYAAHILPGFGSFLDREIPPGAYPAAGLPTLVREVTGGTVGGMVVRTLSAVDFLEVDENGRLQSLVNSDSPYNGHPVEDIREVRSKLPILLLDRESSLAIDTPGPVLLTSRHTGPVRSESVVVMTDEHEATRVDTPILVHDGEVRGVRPGATAIDFTSSLNGGRVLFRKILRKEPLVLPNTVTHRTPPRRSLVKFAWQKMKCAWNWRSVECRWALDAAEAQVVADQTIGREPLRYVVGVAPAELALEMLNPQVRIEGSRIGLAFDLSVNPAAGVLSHLIPRSVAVLSATAWLEDVSYDPARGLLHFARPRLSDVDATAIDDPGLRELVLNGVNLALNRAFDERSAFDVRDLGVPFLRTLARSVEVRDDRLRVACGVYL